MNDVCANKLMPDASLSATTTSVAEFCTLEGVRICIIGLRGVPGVPGGIETHVEQLAPGLVDKGAEVHVFARENYVAGKIPYLWRGITVHPGWAPNNMRLEAIVHTLFALFKARLLKPDIVHIHAVGPSLVAPLARLMGLNVVFTHHGYDYDREKWNAVDKKILRLGEWAGMRFAQGRIVIARHIADAMQAKFKRDVKFIPNGVQVDLSAVDNGILETFDLTKGRYVLLVARLVAEKRQTDLIDAFLSADLPDTKLVLVGGGDARSGYAEMLRSRTKANPNIVLTGSQSGAQLAGLFANAGLFVLPSSHEGMPIALLEAMAYGLPVLASDIEANVALELDPSSYFPLGDVSALSRAMRVKLLERQESLPKPTEAQDTGSKIMSRYNWRTICEQTAALYLSVLKRR